MKRSKKQRTGGFRKGGPAPVPITKEEFAKGGVLVGEGRYTSFKGPVGCVIPINEQTIAILAKALKWRLTPPLEGTEDEDR